jgi:fatty-acid desaturase
MQDPNGHTHRVHATSSRDLVDGYVRYAWKKSLWFSAMALAALGGGIVYASWRGLLLFALSTAAVLLLGHSLGSHRKLIHDSFQCPAWLGYALV